MLQAGWALVVVGLTPLVQFIIGHSIDAVVGSFSYWALLVPPGLYLFLLALLPTDARAIRTVCALSFALSLLVALLGLILR